MLSTIIRNFQNASAVVTLRLHLVDSKTAFKRMEPPALEQSGTGLSIHKLANEARVELARRVADSAELRRPGMKFENEAWRFAAYLIRHDETELRSTGVRDLRRVIPNLCFLAECLSKKFTDGEVRLVCIAQSGQVWLESYADGTTETKSLGSYRS